VTDTEAAGKFFPAATTAHIWRNLFQKTAIVAGHGIRPGYRIVCAVGFEGISGRALVCGLDFAQVRDGCGMEMPLSVSSLGELGIMGGPVVVKAVLVLGPILGLFLLGVIITLRSGVASLSSHQGFERFLGNLSQLLLRMAGYLVGLLALHRFIGAPFEMSL
jgi:hypothetical protein